MSNVVHHTNFQRLGVLFSGGIDSTTIIGEVYKRQKSTEIYPISFDDNSANYRTRRSVAVEQIIGHYQLQTNHYCIRTYDSEFLRMKGSFGLIPGYKMSMQIAAMAYCQSLGIQALAMGYCQENDEYPYTFKDEQVAYIDKIASLYNEIYDADIKISLPYLDLHKQDIINIADFTNTPLEKTISCRSTTFGGLVHCGRCQPCHSRRAGFIASCAEDPTIYHYSSDQMEKVEMETVGTTIVSPHERYKGV